MRLMLTGACGFVAPYVVAEVRKVLGDAVDILATSYDGAQAADGSSTFALDITDASSVARAVKGFAPTHFLHLAGVTTLASAASDPNQAWAINVFGTLNCLKALIAYAPGSVFVFAGTAISYGESARSGHLLTEDDLLQPNNDYGVTKAAADIAIGAMSQRGVTVLRMRPFNHTGPGQSTDFVVPSFADQVARIEKGLQPPVMQVGNLDVARDFLDVRDVARCYVQAMQKADTLSSGRIFNIASGRAPTIRVLLDILLAQSTIKIAVEMDIAHIRENEIPLFAGNGSRTAAEISWKPSISLETMMRDVLAAARKRYRNIHL